MDRFKADLRQIDRLDIAKQGFALPSPIQPRKRLANTEKDALKSSIAYGKSFSPQLGLLSELIKISERPPTLMITCPHMPIGITPSPGPITRATFGLGLEHSIFAFIGGSVQAGFYASISPCELGVFTSLGLGLWSNVGVGLGPTFTVVFGPPSMFVGISWGIGADVGGSGIVSGNGMLLFSAPPFRFLGFAFGLAVGASWLPGDVTVQVNYTMAKPILTFR